MKTQLKIMAGTLLLGAGLPCAAMQNQQVPNAPGGQNAPAAAAQQAPVHVPLTTNIFDSNAAANEYFPGNEEIKKSLADTTSKAQELYKEYDKKVQDLLLQTPKPNDMGQDIFAAKIQDCTRWYFQSISVGDQPCNNAERQKMQSLQDKLAMSETKVQDQTEKLKKLEDDNAGLKTKEEQAEEAMDKSRKEVEELKAALEKKEEELKKKEEQAKVDKQAAIDEIKKTTLEEIKRADDNTNCVKQEFERICAEVKAENNKLAQQNETNQRNIDELNKHNQELLNQNKELTTKVADQSIKIKTLLQTITLLSTGGE